MIGNVLMTDESGTTKSAYDDFNLIIKHKVINAPDPQLHKVEIVGKDGAVDLTDYLTGKVRFAERQINLDFRYLGVESTRTAMVSEFLAFVYGKKIRYTFNDDINYFYVGRMTENTPEVSGAVFDLSTSITVEPFKRDLESSAEEWLWDSFDFELGVINELSEIALPANQYVGFTIVGSYEDYPIVTTGNAPVQIWYDINPSYLETHAIDPQYTVPANSTLALYSLKILTGEHWFTCRAVDADSTVTIDYRGGIL